MVTVTVDPTPDATPETREQITVNGPQFRVNKTDGGDTLKVVSIRNGWLGSFAKSEIFIQGLPGTEAVEAEAIENLGLVDLYAPQES